MERWPTDCHKPGFRALGGPCEGTQDKRSKHRSPATAGTGKHELIRQESATGLCFFVLMHGLGETLLVDLVLCPPARGAIFFDCLLRMYPAGRRRWPISGPILSS